MEIFPCTFLINTYHQNFAMVVIYSIHGFSMTTESFQIEHMEQVKVGLFNNLSSIIVKKTTNLRIKIHKLNGQC